MSPAHHRDSAPPNRRRRVLLAGMAAATGLAAVRVVEMDLLAATQPPPLGEAVTNARRWGMWIDVERCAVGCDACVQACDDEHGLSGKRGGQDAQWIRKLTVVDEADGGRRDSGVGDDATKPAAYAVSLPMLCQHCEHPPCVEVCPTGASFRRADGVVLVDKHTCIGCRYCVLACPYQARAFVFKPVSGQKPYSPRGVGTVEGCTFCVHRIDRGRAPACVEACQSAGGGAMLFGDTQDPHSEITHRHRTQPSNEVRADLGLNTGVRYQNL